MVEIEPKLQSIFRKVLRDDAFVLERDLTAEDVEGWDSLSHLQLIMRTEKEFLVKFTASEATTLPNIGALVDLIRAKIPS